MREGTVAEGQRLLLDAVFGLAGQAEDFEALWQRLAGRVTVRGIVVLAMRFGLVDGRRRTLEETGTTFGLSRERIRFIEHHTLRQLREASGGLPVGAWATPQSMVARVAE